MQRRAGRLASLDRRITSGFILILCELLLWLCSGVTECLKFLVFHCSQSPTSVEGECKHWTPMELRCQVTSSHCSISMAMIGRRPARSAIPVVLLLCTTCPFCLSSFVIRESALLMAGMGSTCALLEKARLEFLQFNCRLSGSGMPPPNINELAARPNLFLCSFAGSFPLFHLYLDCTPQVNTFLFPGAIANATTTSGQEHQDAVLIGQDADLVLRSIMPDHEVWFRIRLPYTLLRINRLRCDLPN